MGKIKAKPALKVGYKPGPRAHKPEYHLKVPKLNGLAHWGLKLSWLSSLKLFEWCFHTQRWHFRYFGLLWRGRVLAALLVTVEIRPSHGRPFWTSQSEL